MHELGIVYEVARQVIEIATREELTQVNSITLQIGELSSVVPEYIRNCYPAAVDGTILEHTELKIEVLPANALCRDCQKVYNLLENKQKCPFCGSGKYEMLSGREFLIKEIEAY